MPRIIAISGSGIGSGKTTLARRLADETWSLAGALRKELKRIYPAVDWFNRTQEYKSRRFEENLALAFPAAAVADGGTWTNRDVMVKYGQLKCVNDVIYWPRILVADLRARLQIADGVNDFAIDDVRKVVEIEYLKEAFGADLMHLHLDTGSAVREGEFDNDALRQRADYLIKWER